MVLVDVKVPALGRQYSFRLNEQETVEHIIEELTGILCQKEQCRLNGETGALSLWSEEAKRELPRAARLAQCGFVTGSILMLL